jgi:hypothetical protein
MIKRRGGCGTVAISRPHFCFLRIDRLASAAGQPDGAAGICSVEQAESSDVHEVHEPKRGSRSTANSDGDSVMTLTREQVVSVLGPLDDETIAEIIQSGASFEELREAWAWAHEDEAFMGQGRPLPGTRVGKLIELLEPDEEEI